MMGRREGVCAHTIGKVAKRTAREADHARLLRREPRRLRRIPRAEGAER